MLYRACVLFIIVFWLTMTALFLRAEWWPGDSSLGEIPPAHVLKVALLHEQASDLLIIHEGQRVGAVRIRTFTRKSDRQRVVDSAGALEISLPGAAHQHLSWDASMELGKKLEIVHAQLAVMTRGAGEIRTEAEFFPPKNRVRIRVKTGELPPDEYSFSLDAHGASQLLRELGIDPALLPAWPSAEAAGLEVKAQLAKLAVRGETVETYLVTMSQSGQTLLEFHVSQLGEILRAHSLVGYDFIADDK